MIFAEKWMELEIIMLSTIIQVHKDKGHMFSLTYEIQPKIYEYNCGTVWGSK
jgi:hypothetical protein